jgi:hypothetical protein
MLTSTVPEMVVALSVDHPICRCGATPDNSAGFVPCDEHGREIDITSPDAGPLYRCVGCGLIVDTATFDEQGQTMRTAGEAMPAAPPTAPPTTTPRTKAPSTRSCQGYLIPGDVTLEYTRDWAKRLVDKVAAAMPGQDLARSGPKALVDLVLRELLDEVCDNYDPDTGRLLSSRAIHASELHQLIREVRSAPNVLAEVFIDHEQIENWAAFVLTTTTGKEPDRAVFTGDCHGLYVGPARELVRRGERVEAVVLSPTQVWFRRERPETSPAQWPLCDAELAGVRVAHLDTTEDGNGRVLAFTHDPRWATVATRWLFTQRRGGEPPASVESGERIWVRVTPDCQCPPHPDDCACEHRHDDAACMWWPGAPNQPVTKGWYARVVRPYTAGAFAVTMMEVWDAR